ncbi:hypothetical protein [Streptomyces sp. NPDC093261]|uniref:hypothetical protein n=1 Tax=Streptomyces sp. NPDC093261 TaxID=3366037 RepID=UPI003826D9DA
MRVRFESLAPMAPRAREKRAAFADALRKRPGDWALLGQHADGTQARYDAYQIRNAELGRNEAFAPAGSFEAEARTLMGEARVYVRYVGGGGGE